MKKHQGLFYKFLTIFLVFVICASAISGAVTYLSQTYSYRNECKSRIREIGEYLESLILSDSASFAFYQDYFMKNYTRLSVPYDFTEYEGALQNFQKVFGQEYPGRVLGRDVPYSELSTPAKDALVLYLHEYWTLVFEKARTAFDLPYTYYLVPNEAEFKMVYMIDGERTKRKSDESLLFLGDEYYNDPEVYVVEWETWATGKKLDRVQEWNNAWGHTYSYYTPLKIGSKKMGLIGTEINVARVNRGILRNSLMQALGITLVLIVCVVILLFVLNGSYIMRIVRMEKYVKKYTLDKDTANARKIEDSSSGNDEIASLGQRISDMILELDNYMKSLKAATRQLGESRRIATEMSAMINKDALTGIRNRNAYDQEVKRLQQKVNENDARFGIAVVDLNFLKKINDTFGHEFGNMAIKNICTLVCQTFKHSPVFRIGGDEFAVVLENRDYDNIRDLVESFNSRVEELSSDKSLSAWEGVSAAIGTAFYAKSQDHDVTSVFKRADKLMYERKEQMKAKRE